MDILSKAGFGLTENAWSLFSTAFLVFLFVTIVFYYLLPKSAQWKVLLAASIVFYFFTGTPYTIIYLLMSSLSAWKAACMMEDLRQTGKDRKTIRRIYLFGLLVNVAILAALKYTNFLLSNASTLASLFVRQRLQWRVSWVAALGVSFYTLQIVSYLTDCYWEMIKPQRCYAKFALFSCFFPQMISGPISRYDQLAVQLYEEHPFQWDNVMGGFIRISLGFFKKLVIAENFSRLAQFFFDREQGYYYGVFGLAGIICYVIEVFGDFSGCMDIVLGAAKCLGIHMVENFNLPFRSTSIQEFWQRWHITLGTWLKDYIMYPLLRSKAFQKLGKKLKKKYGKQFSQKATTYLAMLILWLCMGLWHGGGWNYIAEGIWFWSVIVLGQLTAPFFDRVLHSKEHNGLFMTLFRRGRTVAIYAVGAIFFRSPTVIEALKIIYRSLSPNLILLSINRIPRFIYDAKQLELSDCRMLFLIINSVLGFALFVILSLWEGKYGKLHVRLTEHTRILQLTSILVIFYFIFFLGVYGSGFNPSAFIYGGF